MNWVAKFEDWCSRRYVYWPLVMLLAAATPLAFAPYYHFWLMPLLFGALIRLTELRPRNSVSGAYCFGLAGYAAQFYWIHTALHDISGLPNLYALPLTILLPAYLALYPAACFWLLEKARLPRGWRIGLLLPVLWTLAEFARERAITGFGWGALGYSQVADLSPLAGYAPVGGVHLLTLLCAFCGAWLVLVLHNQGWKRRALPLVLLIGVIVSGWQLRQVRFTEPDGSSATVALAQGNVAQTLKWDAEYLSETMQSYYEQVANSHADITILPETAIPVMRQDLQEYNPGILDQFAYEAQRNGSALAMGIAQYNQQRTGYLNAVINLSNYHPDRPDDIPFYAKDHLVPFGEYKPLPAITEPLYRMMNMPLAGFERGGRAQASLLANVSTLGWFIRSNAVHQHLQISQTRALELGRYMVRATNTGATAIINPQGRVVKLAPPDTRTVLEGTIEGYRGETPYMKMGGSLPLVCGLLCLTVLLMLAGYLPRRKPAPDAAEERLPENAGEPSAEPQNEGK